MNPAAIKKFIATLTEIDRISVKICQNLDFRKNLEKCCRFRKSTGLRGLIKVTFMDFFFFLMELNDVLKSRFLPFLYEKYFNASKFLNMNNLNDPNLLVSKLKIFLNCLLILAEVDHLNKRQKRDIVSQLKKIELVNHLLKSTNLNKTKANIIKETRELYHCIFNVFSILKKLLEYFQMPTQHLDESIEDVIKIKTEFETTTNIQLDIVEEIRIIPSSIPNLITEFFENMQKIHQETTDEINNYRLKNHMCLKCRNNPALYFAKPCCHSFFCSKCAEELIAQNFTYSRCLLCKNNVETIEVSKFLI